VARVWTCDVCGNIAGIADWVPFVVHRSLTVEERGRFGL
jgi:hypothetical protein